jgi:hypothetical protein
VTFRRKIYYNLEELQKDLDGWLEYNNNSLTHQGKHYQGRTPMKTFVDSLELYRRKNLENEKSQVFDTCQLYCWSNYMMDSFFSSLKKGFIILMST